MLRLSVDFTYEAQVVPHRGGADLAVIFGCTFPAVVEIPEVSIEAAPVAYEISARHGVEEDPVSIRGWKSRLWKRAYRGGTSERAFMSLDDLSVWLKVKHRTDGAHHAPRLKPSAYRRIEYSDEARVRAAIVESARQFVLIGGEVYIETTAPYYIVASVGPAGPGGHFALLVGGDHRSYLGRSFRPEELDLAVDAARAEARACGHTRDVSVPRVIAYAVDGVLSAPSRYGVQRYGHGCVA